MEETRKCVKCNEIKPRLLVGKFDYKNKKYHDQNGKTWRGSVCPDCHKKDMKERMQAARVLKKYIENEE